MKALIDCRMSTWSGIGRYCVGLTRALAQLPDLEIVQLTARGSEPPVPGAPSVVASAHPFSMRGALEFGRIARRVSPDLTHALHFPTPLPAVHPLVVTMQDLTPLAVEGVMPSPLRRLVYKGWTTRAVNVADRVIAPSQFSARDVVRFFPHAEGKTRVVLLAADDFTAGLTGDLPAWLQGKRFVLSMGNTKPHKDLVTLLRAFASLADPELLLVLAGIDPGGYVASVLDDDPAATRVRFTGAIDDDTLRALYANAAALAFPSRYEGFGLPPLEAMAFGTPVVTSSAASLPEVVGDAALVVSPGDVGALGDALARVLADASLAGRLSEAGRARAAAFTWQHTAEATLGIYREVLGA